MTIENSGDGHDEDNPWGKGSKEEADNIISLELKKKEKEAQKPEKNAGQERLINLPDYTKYFAGLLIIVFLIVNYLLPEDKAQWVFLHLGFIPGRYTGTFDFSDEGDRPIATARLTYSIDYRTEENLATTAT